MIKNNIHSIILLIGMKFRVATIDKTQVQTVLIRKCVNTTKGQILDINFYKSSMTITKFLITSVLSFFNSWGSKLLLVVNSGRRPDFQQL
jgi:hypothetical protein